MTGLRRYGEIRKQTASREQLLAQLFEAAARHMRDGKAALEAKRRLEGAERLNKATAIVRYLMATLDVRKAPELCRNLARVYEFVCQRLVVGAMRGDGQAVAEAQRAFAPVSDAFRNVLGSQAEAQQ